MNVLQTERLKLRQFELGDEPFVMALLNDASFLRFIGDKGVRTLDDATEYLRSGPMASYLEHGYGLFHVADRASGESAGMCGLLQRAGYPYADVGFAFMPEYQSKGIAFEAATTILDYGHEQLDMRIIDAFVDPANERSIKLLVRLGMDYLGRVKVAGVGGDEQCLYRIERRPV